MWIRRLRALPFRRTARSALGPALLVGALAVTTLGCGAEEQVAPKGAVYAALGDSDSSGAGIAPVVRTDCLRSANNYPSLVARELGHSSFEDVTCAGATTANLLRAQVTKTSANDPQLDAVGSRTRLVTLTLGLNDDNLSYNLFAACLLVNGQEQPHCERVLDAPDSAVDKEIDEAAERLRDAITLIRKQAPRARVVLVGYPRFFPDGADCPDRVPMVPEMVPRLRTALADLNEAWRQVAEETGADYVDTWRLTKGHDVCADQPWINGAEDVAGKASALHPFAEFHRTVATEIVSMLGAEPAVS